MVRGNNWVQALVYAGLCACIVAAPAANAQRTTDIFERGTALSEVARQLADEFPGLSNAQVSRLMLAANPTVFDSNNRLRMRDALLLPRSDVGRQVVGLAPPPASVPIDTIKQGFATEQETRPTAPRPELAPATPVSTADAARARRAVAAAASAKQAGDAQRAYELLAAQLNTLGGNPEYDYALGTTALDAGYYSEAAFALQRVVFAQPRFAGARLDLARTHIALGDYDAARLELDRVEQAEPPPKVQTAVQVLREQIDSATVANIGLGWSGRLAAVAGYDSNANAATSDSQVVLGGIPITLTDQSREIESPVYGADASIGYAARLTETATLSTALGLTHRQYPDAEFVDATTAFGQFGQTYTWDAWSANVGVAGAYTLLDDAFNNRSIRTDLGVARRFGQSRLGLTGRVGVVRYADDVNVQDVNQRLGALTYARTLGGRALVSFSGLVGRDVANQPGSPYGRSLTGVRSRLLAAPADSLELVLNLGYVESEFDGLFLGAQRDDDQFTSSLLLTFKRLLWDSLDLGASVRYIDNESTAVLFDYQRSIIGLNLAKEF